MERSPYKAGDIIAQETWYNRGVNNVGLVISDERESVALVLWRVPEKESGSCLLWTHFDDSHWEKVHYTTMPRPRVIASYTYLVHRPR